MPPEGIEEYKTQNESIDPSLAGELIMRTQTLPDANKRERDKSLSHLVIHCKCICCQ